MGRGREVSYVAINNLLEQDCLQIAAPLTDDFGPAFRHDQLQVRIGGLLQL